MFRKLVRFNGRLLTHDGVYYDTLTSSHGCDSILRLGLTVTAKFIHLSPAVFVQVVRTL